MKKVMIWKTNKELLKTMLCPYSIEKEYKFSFTEEMELNLCSEI